MSNVFDLPRLQVSSTTSCRWVRVIPDGEFLRAAMMADSAGSTRGILWRRVSRVPVFHDSMENSNLEFSRSGSRSFWQRACAKAALAVLDIPEDVEVGRELAGAANCYVGGFGFGWVGEEEQGGRGALVQIVEGAGYAGGGGVGVLVGHAHHLRQGVHDYEDGLNWRKEFGELIGGVVP